MVSGGKGRRAALRRGLAACLLTLGTALAASAGAGAVEAQARETVEKLIAQVNAVRAEHRLVSLEPDRTLQALSQDYAALMAVSDCLSHNCAGRGKVGDRARNRGYDYLLIGEALAGGPPDVEKVVQLWMMSEPHRAILLNDEVRQIGAGHFYQPDDTGRADYGHYWVLTVSLRP